MEVRSLAVGHDPEKLVELHDSESRTSRKEKAPHSTRGARAQGRPRPPSSFEAQPAGEGAFELEQAALHLEAARVAGERAVRADHPMAGDDDADRVVVIGEADRARGRGARQAARDLAVGAGGAERDPQELAPDGTLELRALRLERQLEIATGTAQVFGQLPAHLGQGLDGGIEEGLGPAPRAAGRGILPGRAMLERDQLASARDRERPAEVVLEQVET